MKTQGLLRRATAKHEKLQSLKKFFNEAAKNITSYHCVAKTHLQWVGSNECDDEKNTELN